MKQVYSLKTQNSRFKIQDSTLTGCTETQASLSRLAATPNKRGSSPQFFRLCIVHCALCIALLLGMVSSVWGQTALRATTDRQAVGSTGEYKAPTGYYIYQIECWGGGGSGQWRKNDAGGGYGGGGGGYAAVTSLDLPYNSVIKVTGLGAGGAGVTSGAGNNGGTAKVQLKNGSSYEDYVYATGGYAGGNRANSSSAYGAGGYGWKKSGLTGTTHTGGKGGQSSRNGLSRYYSGGGGGGAGNEEDGSPGGNASSWSSGDGGDGGTAYGGNGGDGSGTAVNIDGGAAGNGQSDVNGYGGGGGGTTHGTSGSGGNGCVMITLKKSTVNVYLYANDNEADHVTPAEWSGAAANTAYPVTYGQQLNINSTLANLGTCITRTGYDFEGWYTAATGGTKVEATSTCNQSAITWSNITGTLKLYAHWKPKTYTCTVHSNGGNIIGTCLTKIGTDNVFDVVYDQPMNFNLGTCDLGSSTGIEKVGYTLEGWYWNSSFSSDIVYLTGIWKDGNRDIYAKWTANEYVVHLNANGGNLTGKDTFHLRYDNTYGSNSRWDFSSQVSRDNYTFRGWNTAANGSGTAITFSTTFQNANDNTTLYAQWEQNINAQDSTTPVTCHNDGDGSIIISNITGGQGLYKLQLYKNGSTVGSVITTSASTYTFSSLAGGTYSVRIWDDHTFSSNSCSKEITNIVVYEPDELVLTLDKIHDIDCDYYGEVNAEWTGGNEGTFDLSWSGPRSDNESDLTERSYEFEFIYPGTYTVTASDSKSCSATASVSIVDNATQPTVAPITATVCNGSESHIPVPSGYRYVWHAPSQSDYPNVSGLASGSYEVDFNVNLTNHSNEPQTVVYSVKPYLRNCIGQNFQITVIVGTEPCADVEVSVDPINDTCAGRKIPLVARVNRDAGGEYSLNWTFPDVTTEPRTGLTGDTVMYFYSIPDDFCSGEITFMVTYADNAGIKTAVGTIPVVVGSWTKPDDVTADEPVNCVSDLPAYTTITPATVTTSCGKIVNVEYVGLTHTPNADNCGETATYTFRYHICLLLLFSPLW